MLVTPKCSTGVQWAGLWAGGRAHHGLHPRADGGARQRGDHGPLQVRLALLRPVTPCA